MRHHLKHLSVSVLALACMGIMSSARADDTPRVDFGGSLKAQYILDDDTDLETAAQGQNDSESLEAKIRAKFYLPNDFTAFTEVRGVKNYGAAGGFDLETGESIGRDDFVELRQLWIDKDHLFGITPLSARIGRQRFSEPYGLWWNRDMDAARISYDTTILSTWLALGENLHSYRSTHDDFNERDEDVMRAMSETMWQYQKAQFLDLRFVYQDDHSGMESPGTTIDPDDRDAEDGDLFWAGARFHGDGPTYFEGRGPIQYRVDIMGVTGDADEQTLAGSTVTGSTNRDVMGWGLDAGVDIPLPSAIEPLLTLGYAYGSGDDNNGTGTDHGFRQTGLDSNTDLFNQSSGTIYHYGFALRPDLNNIHIFTVGLGVPLFTASDFTTTYHYYRLDDPSAGLVTSGIDAPLNGTDHDLGHSLDLALNVNLTEELGLQNSVTGPITMKAVVGGFRAGDAYGDAEGEYAARGLLELQVRF